MATRVIGIGQPSAGDDGVGYLILDALEQLPLPHGTELIRIQDASALVDLVLTDRAVIVVDAVLDPEHAGAVRLLDEQALDASSPGSVSTHGLGVIPALELARILYADRIAKNVCFVTVAIAAPRGYSHELSDGVAAAVPKARDHILEMLSN